MYMNEARPPNVPAYSVMKQYASAYKSTGQQSVSGKNSLKKHRTIMLKKLGK